MMFHFREAYHFGQIVLQLIGLGTILKGVAWLYKRKQDKLENRVLEALAPQGRGWHWQSGHGVVARMKRDAAYAYAAAVFPPRVEDWLSFISRLRVIPRQIAYLYHRKFIIPSKRRADTILRDLWKRGLLICPLESTGSYQLKEFSRASN
jgi:hypothetical protein